MGWLDTPEQRRKQHLQMIATGNIKDIDRIQERDRRRSINAIFWSLFIVGGLLGWLMLKSGFVKQSYYLFGFALLFLIIIIFRYGLHRKVKLGKNKDSWERLREVPDWVYKKMKRRRTNHVNGDHYRYKREGNNYYRKKEVKATPLNTIIQATKT